MTLSVTEVDAIARVVAEQAENAADPADYLRDLLRRADLPARWRQQVIGRPVVPSRYGQRYAIGHIVENGRHLFVTPGLGTSIIPVRFLVPPEISLLDLVAPSFAPGAGGR